VFELFNDNCAKTLTPSDYLSLDETLYSTRNKINFRQYNANKPAKYGLLFKSINCARSPYTHRIVVYAGKPAGEPGIHYTPGILPTVTKLVGDLMAKTCLKGRNITMDRLYTSFPLFEWLLSKGITALGTMMLNRVGIPPGIKPTAGRQEKSYVALWEKDVGKKSLHSYVVNTKSKGRRNVMLLSTVPPLLGTTKDDGK